jgi:DNA-binding transcriptional MerR regulator
VDPRLLPWRARADLTLDEVVDAADALLEEVAPRQTRYAVTERPDVRTIRYYTTRGLLPKPLSYDGGRARYGFPHLLRLLAIKRMQAEHLTLEQIARVLARKGEDELVALVAGEAPPPGPAPQAAPVPAVLGTDLTLELSPGGRLVVSAGVVADAAARERLAHNLEELARMLRAMSTTNQGGGDV